MAIVGDVHGDSRRLGAMLARQELKGRVVVFVGDLVDRGPDSKGVLDLVASRVASGEETKLLLGHHELYLLGYLRDGDFVKYASAGGVATIASYVGVAKGDVYRQFRACFPAEHLKLLEAGLVYWESDDVLISHVGLALSNPASRSVDDMVLRAHPELFKSRVDVGKMVVCGHYTQRGGRPFVSSGFVCVDTGCGTDGGPLTALLLPEQIFISE